MIDFIRRIITNVLEALYQPFGFALLFAIVFMFLFMYAEEHGCRETVRLWLSKFKNSICFRRTFLLSFYTAMILFRTLLGRYILNPLDNVIGVWGIYDRNGELTTETIENLALFIPFTVLLLWSFHNKMLVVKVTLLKIIWKSIKIVFLFSLTIEMLQLFLRLGTFQLSDLVYNTLGGLIGGLIYWLGYKITHTKKK